MKGKVGKKFNLKRTSNLGVVYAVMGKVSTKPIEKQRVFKHGITSRVTKEMEEYRYEHKY